MTTLLLAAGIDLSVRAEDGTTAVDWAEMMGHEEVAQLIKKETK